MNYITELLTILPFAFLAALIIYAIIFMLAGKKREKPGIPAILAEFALVGWFVVFIYVTQIKSFGNGMGELCNLEPLHMFYIAFRYGSNNAAMVWQFLLNILMFVPLGLLLPVVFPHKCRTWPPVAMISFGITLATELLQLISRRGTDIDDIIANTAGGLCGFGLFLLGYGVVRVIRSQQLQIPQLGRKLVCGMCVLCVVSGLFIAVKWADSSQYGNLYYGHLQPSAVTIDDSVSDQESVRNVYQYTEHTSLSELQGRLLEASGFTGHYTKGDELYTLAKLEDGDDRRIFIYPYNTWRVTYVYGGEREADAADIPDPAAALAFSWEYLESYGITADAVEYKDDISDTYGHAYRRLQFISTESTEELLVFGAITVAIGDNGQLVEIYDTRRWCELVAAVECISPRESIGIAQDVGVGEIPWQATVTTVDEGHSFIDETGYLIPTWDISAQMRTGDGKEYDWNPVVDAIK